MDEAKPATIEAQATKATGVVALALIAGNAVSFLKNAIVAANLGTGWQMDAFLWAYALVTLFALLLMQPLTAVLVPVFLALREKSRESASRLINSLLGFSFAVFVGLGVVLAILAPTLARLLLVGMSADGITLATDLIWLMLPVVVLSGVVAVAQATLTAEKSFFISSLSPYLPTVVVIVAVLIVSKTEATVAQAIGYSLGVLLQSAILLGLMRKKGLGRHWRLNSRAAGMHQTLRLLWPLVATQVLILALPLVDRTMAASQQPGAISALGYAQMIMMATVAVVVTAVQTAILPFLSQQVSSGELGAFRATLLKALRSLIAFLLPATIILIILAEPTIRVVFERGSFDLSATRLTVPAFIAYMVGAVPMAITFICSRGFNALQDSKTNALVGVLFLVVVKLLLNFLFTRLWGYWGLALATSCAYLATSVAMLWIMRNKLRGFLNREFGVAIVKIILSSIIAIPLIWWGGHRLAYAPMGNFIIGASMGIIGFLAAAYFLKLDEVRSITIYATQRLVRAKRIIDHKVIP